MTAVSRGVQSNPSIEPGEVVKGIVSKLEDDAVFLNLPGGIRGVIKRNWLPNEYRRRSCRHSFSRGTVVEAEVRATDQKKHMLLLRFRKVLHDPWVEARPALQRDGLVRGTVYNVQPDGIFIELLQGIPARVPVEEIPNATSQSIEKLVWVGDFVEGRVIGIDDSKREISVSIGNHLAALLEHRKKTLAANKQADVPILLRNDRPPESHPKLYELQRGSGRIKRVLLIDNDRYYLDTVADWLLGNGYEVEKTTSGEEGVRLATTLGHDLILMDAHMPDLEGLQAAARIRNERPNLTIIVVTGDLNFALQLEPAELVDEVISKYGGLEALEQVIARIETAEIPQRGTGSLSGLGREIEILRQHSEMKNDFPSLEENFVEILRAVAKSTEAETAIVFRMELATRKVSAFATVGKQPPNEDGLLDLRFSPVNDVLGRAESVFTGNALASERKYDYLLRYLLFRSCIGIRIEGKPIWRSQCHGLFLFHPNEDHFDSVALTQAMLGAKLMAIEVDRHELRAREDALQPLRIAGLLSSGLVHEINNQLSATDQALHGMRQDYKALMSGEAELALNTRRFIHLGQSISSMETATTRLRNVAGSFLGLFKPEEATRIRLNEVLDEAWQVIDSDTYTQSHILARFELADNIPDIWGIRSRLQRVFINVMLNAVQQIKAHSRFGGLLLISTSYDPTSDERPIKIRIQDTGPGIHRAHFEKIFERGFSSREEGTGLGLYITKGLIESMHGTVSVEDSLLFVGSSIIIELPSAPKAKETKI